jgi:hypothetical protein
MVSLLAWIPRTQADARALPQAIAGMFCLACPVFCNTVANS